MKVRTITAGVNLAPSRLAASFGRAARFLNRAREEFIRSGFQVQSVRISTQPWPEYARRSPAAEVLHLIRTIEETAARNGVSFVSIGTTSDLDRIKLLPEIITNTERVSASVSVADARRGIDYDAARAAALAIREIGRRTDRGYGNFRFCAAANCPAGIPFYPAGFHRGPDGFAVGLECGDLVVRSFARVRSPSEAARKLARSAQREFGRVSATAERLARGSGFRFLGLDASIAPGLGPGDSLVRAYEEFGLGRFGSAGTLAISSLITDVLKDLKIKKCGYSGLMLPVLEDRILARRFGSGSVDIPSLLAYSSVCGTGLDCIPLPGNVRAEKLYAIIIDVAALAIKLDKPLSCRLLPVPGKRAGERTDFRSPYLVDCRIPPIK